MGGVTPRIGAPTIERERVRVLRFGMRVGAIAVVLLHGMMVSGCGPSDRAPAEAGADHPAWTLFYHLEGGIEGYDVQFRFDATGLALYERMRPGSLRVERRLAISEAESFAALVRESGLGSHKPGSRPMDTGDDKSYRYTIYWKDGGRTSEVRFRDGELVSTQIVAVRDAIGALQRRTLGRDTPASVVMGSGTMAPTGVPAPPFPQPELPNEKRGEVR